MRCIIFVLVLFIWFSLPAGAASFEQLRQAEKLANTHIQQASQAYTKGQIDEAAVSQRNAIAQFQRCVQLLDQLRAKLTPEAYRMSRQIYGSALEKSRQFLAQLPYTGSELPLLRQQWQVIHGAMNFSTTDLLALGKWANAAHFLGRSLLDQEVVPCVEEFQKNNIDTYPISKVENAIAANREAAGVMKSYLEKAQNPDLEPVTKKVKKLYKEAWINSVLLRLIRLIAWINLAGKDFYKPSASSEPGEVTPVKRMEESLEDLVRVSENMKQQNPQWYQANLGSLEPQILLWRAHALIVTKDKAQLEAIEALLHTAIGLNPPQKTLASALDYFMQYCIFIGGDTRFIEAARRIWDKCTPVLSASEVTEHQQWKPLLELIELRAEQELRMNDADLATHLGMLEAVRAQITAHAGSPDPHSYYRSYQAIAYHAFMNALRALPPNEISLSAILDCAGYIRHIHARGFRTHNKDAIMEAISPTKLAVIRFALAQLLLDTPRHAEGLSLLTTAAAEKFEDSEQAHHLIARHLENSENADDKQILVRSLRRLKKQRTPAEQLLYQRLVRANVSEPAADGEAPIVPRRMKTKKPKPAKLKPAPTQASSPAKLEYEESLRFMERSGATTYQQHVLAGDMGQCQEWMEDGVDFFINMFYGTPYVQQNVVLALWELTKRASYSPIAAHALAAFYWHPHILPFHQHANYTDVIYQLMFAVAYPNPEQARILYMNILVNPQNYVIQLKEAARFWYQRVLELVPPTQSQPLLQAIRADAERMLGSP